MRSGKAITLRRRKCKRRVRAKVVGTAQRPRLSIVRSNWHIYAQLIDDAAGNTIAAASTKQKAFAEELRHELTDTWLERAVMETEGARQFHINWDSVSADE